MRRPPLTQSIRYIKITFRSWLQIEAVPLRLGLILVLLALCLQTNAAPPDAPPSDQAASSKHWSQVKPVAGEADGFAETPELIKLGPGQPVVSPAEEGATKMIPVRYFRRSSMAKGAPSQRDPVVQSSAPTLNTPSPSISFAG